MLKSLFRVILDGREIYIVANNEREAENHCFSFFDYSTLKMYFISSQETQEEFPYIIDRDTMNYA